MVNEQKKSRKLALQLAPRWGLVILRCSVVCTNVACFFLYNAFDVIIDCNMAVPYDYRLVSLMIR